MGSDLEFTKQVSGFWLPRFFLYLLMKKAGVNSELLMAV